MTNEQKAAYVQALQHEREGYVAHGKDDRVADVDKELKRLGVAPQARAAPSPPASASAQPHKSERRPGPGKRAQKRSGRA